MRRVRSALVALGACGAVLVPLGTDEPVAQASPASDRSTSIASTTIASTTIATGDRGADERVDDYTNIYAWFAALHRFDIDGWSPPVLDVGGVKLRVPLNGFDPRLNVATVFVNITDLPLRMFNPENVIDVEWLREHRPDLYEQLNVGSTVSHVWALSRFSAPLGAREGIWRLAGKPGRPPKNWLHSEDAFTQHLKWRTETLREMGALKPNKHLLDRAYLVLSERDNCRPCSHLLRMMPSRPRRLSMVRLGSGSVTEEMERRLDGVRETVIEAALNAGDGPVLPPPASTSEGIVPPDAGFFEVEGPSEGRPCPPVSRSWVRPALSQAATSGCGEAEASNGIVDGLATSRLGPGGVDFSTMELRYLADGDDSGQGVRYAFSAGSSDGSGRGSRKEGLEAARLSSDAFFVWLSLPPSTFRVNLNPREPDDIVDARLGRTDVGRVLLEADLQMKRTNAELTHPRTPLGERYWRMIEGNCVSGRTWIVPGPAKVRDTGDELYIIDAPLRVRTEAAYLSERGELPADASCPQQSRAERMHGVRVTRRLIIPRLEHAVNTAPEYADLRRVYFARVAAEWYRERSESEATTFGHLIDRGDIDAWETRTDWEPIDTFKQYLHSHRHGEYKVVDEVEVNGAHYRRTRWYGGIVLTDVPRDEATAAELAAAWPGFADQVDASLSRPMAGGPEPGSTLLGGETRHQPSQQRHHVGSPTDTSTWVWLAAPPLGVVLLLGLMVSRRRARAGR